MITTYVTIVDYQVYEEGQETDVEYAGQDIEAAKEAAKKAARKWEMFKPSCTIQTWIDGKLESNDQV